MAIKDQCKNCRKYNQSDDICTETNQMPLYNSSSCEIYSSIRINLTKTEGAVDCNIYSPTIPQTSTDPISPINKKTNSTGWRRLFSFEGRIGRGEYWLSYIVYNLYCLPMNVMEEDDINVFFALIWLILFIPMVWMIIAQGVKRCHDRGNNGWYQIIPFYFIWMAFAPGDDGPKEYGVR